MSYCCICLLLSIVSFNLLFVSFSLSVCVLLVKYFVLLFARAFHRSCLKVSAVKRIKAC